MSAPLILLPGWGLGAAALQPLAEALGPRVQIAPLPRLATARVDDWLDALDRCLPRDAWLVGWSLGGMLASLLAARRGAGCPGLITCASNVRFVAASSWPQAMLVETFTAFREAYGANPSVTLKRFAMLCSQGAVEPKALSRQLQGVVDGSDSSTGLELLGQLDTLSALRSFAGPQLHLFAGADGLVPVQVADAVQDALADACVQVIAQASHAMVVEQVDQVAERIRHFMEAHS